MKTEKIILIDGSSYFFRAFYAIARLTNSKGFPTNAILGFINMLNKVLEVEKPTKLGICFDPGKPSFRRDMYAEYKANRDAAPEDLVVQIPEIQKAVDAFGICRLQAEGFEADDVIATVAHRAREEGYPVEIISADKDLMQLIDKHVSMFDTMKDKKYGPKEVEEKFGVPPERIIDLLALMGDSSDNIPGVAGIGPKTAALLLNEYGSLDGLYAGVDSIKQKKRKETLVEHKEMAYLSRDLVRLRQDVPLDFNWKELDYSGPNNEALQAVFEEFEFTGLLKRFGMEPGAVKSTQAESSYICVQDERTLNECIAALKAAKGPVCIDTETTSLRPHDAKVVGISLSVDSAKAYYIPLGHKQGQQLGEEQVRAVLKPIFEDSDCLKLGQNLKYDYQILKGWGVKLAGIHYDTLLESYLLDPDKSHGLDALAKRHLGHTNISYEEVCGKGKSQISFADVPIDKATDYAAEDAAITLRLHETLFSQMAEAGVQKLFDEVEIPLIPVLAEMEYAGIRVNASGLTELNAKLEKEIETIKKKVFEIAGEEFNLNSPKQLSKILFEKLELPVIKKTKTGFSTDENVLNELSSKHEIAQWLLKNRELTKLKSTYVEGLLGQINSHTGRVHTSFNQTIASTGRLSSSDPNLQNIPISRSDGYDIRSMFIADEGCELLFPDYSQVELRVLAHMSGDKELCRAFENDEDIHSYTGKLIFGVDEVSAEQRRVAKTINFGVVYGQTPYGLSRQLKISNHEAKKFIDSYFERYSGVKSFMNQIVEGARKDGYVRTLLGRRRFVPEIDTRNRMRREMAERAAINTPIQGTAADMIKLAMIRIARRLKVEQLKTRMLLQVHDELVFEVPIAEKAQVEALVLGEMQNAMKLDVPLRVDPNWGTTWSKS